MKRIIVKIDQEINHLENSALCQWLRSIEPSDEDRFAFTPSMLFFVLGFKDILHTMRIEDPKTPIDFEINTHCEEDLDHWKWYLSDLEVLGFLPKSWGGSMADIFTKIWGNESIAARNLVYTTLYYIKKHNNPLISLAIIEVLEAAFGVFIRHMTVPINRAGVYEKLEYFGKTHIDKENAHARGAWTNGTRSDSSGSFQYHLLDEATYQIAEDIVDNIVSEFKAVFDYWYSARKEFVRYVPPVAENLRQASEPVA